MRTNSRILQLLVLALTGGATLIATRPATAQIAAYISDPAALDTAYSTTTDGIFKNDFDIAPWTRNTEYVAPVVVPSFGTYQFTPTERGDVFFGDGANGTGGNGQFGNGTGNFLGIGDFWTGSGTSTNGVAIDFGAPQRYFGFAWNAGDGGNTISFFSGGTLFARYQTAQTLSVIPSNSTVTNGNGVTYDTDDYYGQPGTGFNTGETYTYLNFFGTNGVTFDRVVLDNVGDSGFESDNHAISTQTLTPQGIFVPAGFAASVVPETGTLALMALPLLGGLALRLRRRK